MTSSPRRDCAATQPRFNWEVLLSFGAERVMVSNLMISFHNLPHSDAVEHDIRERVAKLESLFDKILRCRVVVEAPSKNAAGAHAFAVNIEIAVPGQDIVVRPDPSPDMHSAVTTAFDAAKRRLKTHAERRRH